MSDPHLPEGSDHEFAPFNFPDFEEMTEEQREVHGDIDAPASPIGSAAGELDRAYKRVVETFGPGAVLTLTV